MYLVSCEPPAGPLDPAPRTSLISDADAPFCATFWSAEGTTYYVCRIEMDGTERWLEMRDEDVAAPRGTPERAIASVVVGEALARRQAGGGSRQGR